MKEKSIIERITEFHIDDEMKMILIEMQQTNIQQSKKIKKLEKDLLTLDRNTAHTMYDMPLG